MFYNLEQDPTWVKPQVSLVQGYDHSLGMEYVCRNCYQSFDKLGKTDLLAHALMLGHDSVLEFSEVLVITDKKRILSKLNYILDFTCQYPYVLKFRGVDPETYLFSGNLRAWLNVIDHILQYPCLPSYKSIAATIFNALFEKYPFLKLTEYQDVLSTKPDDRVSKSLTVYVRNVFDLNDGEQFKDSFPSWWRDGRRVVVNVVMSRACLAQWTRHRRFSYLVESQRYVRYDDYSLKKINPFIRGDIKDVKSIYDNLIYVANLLAFRYGDLLKAGEKPQVARLILPNITACSAMICGSLSEFRYFIALRQTEKADREIAYLAKMLKQLLQENDLY